MGKHKGEIEMGIRAAEEINRLFPTERKATAAMGCDRKLFQNWRCGATPSGYFLARLHYAGGDVMYVLTGRRSNGHDSKPQLP